VGLEAPVSDSSAHIGCDVRLVKEKDGSVRILVRNLSPQLLVLQRYGDRRSKLVIQTPTSGGNWKQLEPLQRGLVADPVEEEPWDWVVLGDGDEVSWLLEYNMTARLRVGDRARIVWNPNRSAPPYPLARAASKFPAARWTEECIVR